MKYGIVECRLNGRIRVQCQQFVNERVLSPGLDELNTDGIGAERNRNGAGAVEFQWMHQT